MLFNLIMYSESAYFSKMRDILRSYLITLQKSDVAYLFYCYSPTIKSDYVIEGDTLYIKGNESYVPGTIDKTVEAISIVRNLYDFTNITHIVRSNISTIVNFGLLIEHMKAELTDHASNYASEYASDYASDYAGGMVMTITRVDKGSGIIDDQYNGIRYVSGTCIILSKKAVDLLLCNVHDINYTVVDDVSLGLFYAKHGIDAVKIDRMGYNVDQYVPTKLFYRNRRPNRFDDCSIMMRILSGIMNKDEDNDSSRINSNMKARYGVIQNDEYRYTDVSKIIVVCFVKDGRLIIPRTIKFNDYFGDPAPYVCKYLDISCNSVILSIKEDRTHDINVELD